MPSPLPVDKNSPPHPCPDLSLRDSDGKTVADTCHSGTAAYRPAHYAPSQDFFTFDMAACLFSDWREFWGKKKDTQVTL